MSEGIWLRQDEISLVTYDEVQELKVQLNVVA